jgi:E3 ubiquitin-protein ligase FANCL
MNSRFFVLPDREMPNLSLCLMSIGNTDFVFRASKSPPYFEAEPKLSHILKDTREYVKAELDRSQSLESFCQRMLHFVSNLIPSSPDASLPPASYFRRVLEQIRGIGWDYISSVDPTLSFFTVGLSDESGRRIEIQFSLPNAFPRVGPKVTSNLPLPVPFEWDPQQSRLSEIVDRHRELIPTFDPFWKQLEDIDREAFVIEPRDPSLDCCFRRIVVTSQVEIQIEVDPIHPFIPPKVSFIGATVQSSEMRKLFDSRIRDWQTGASLKANLENALGIDLPAKEADDITMSSFDCGICYAVRLGGEIPEIICSNIHCSKRFHRSCLLNWLRTGTSEQSFQVVFGVCPYCDAQIQCTVNRTF